MGRQNSGFTLLELAIVLAVGAILAGAVSASFVRGVRVEAARKTALEIAQLQDAARSYYAAKKAWPVDIKALADDGYVGAGWAGKSVFGQDYRFAVSGKGLEVRVQLPGEVQGVLQNLLPMSTVEGKDVVSLVTAFDALLSTIPTGGMMPWPSHDLPEGWLWCDGSVASRTDQEALFKVIGTQYGAGDGSTTFTLPDLRGRTVVGRDDMGGNAASVITGPWGRQLGGVFGEEEHVLSVAEMPAHTHGVPRQIASSTGDSMSHADWYPSEYKWGQPSSPAGGDRPHNNIQPSIVFNWIIKY